VLQEVEEAQAVGGEAVGGPIRISVPVTVGQHAGPELIAPLMAEYPRMRVDLRLEDRLIDLALEDVDIAIRAAPNPPMSEQVIAVPLTAWSRILVAAPSYLKRAGTPRMPEDLAGHDVLAPGLDVHAATWSLVREGRTTSVRVRARLVSNGGDALCDLAIAGYGITMLPPWFVAPAIKGRRLARVLPEWESAPTVIYLLYRAAARKQQQVKRVVEHLRRVYAETER
jgi:DNA-binding transcriptional LysR family regulator